MDYDKQDIIEHKKKRIYYFIIVPALLTLSLALFIVLIMLSSLFFISYSFRSIKMLGSLAMILSYLSILAGLVLPLQLSNLAKKRAYIISAVVFVVLGIICLILSYTISGILITH